MTKDQFIDKWIIGSRRRTETMGELQRDLDSVIFSERQKEHDLLARIIKACETITDEEAITFARKMIAEFQRSDYQKKRIPEPWNLDRGGTGHGDISFSDADPGL